MASAKTATSANSQRNGQDIVNFLLGTYDELLDLSDSGFENIMNATDVSSEDKL